MACNTRTSAALTFVVVIFNTNVALANALKGRNIAVVASISPSVAGHQTIKLAPAMLAKPLAAGLSDAGFPTAIDGDDLQLRANVVAYDSGSYLGFAKTATIAVDFELRDTQGATIKAWHGDCKQRVAFNMNSTATRNAEAVTMCIEQLAQDAVAAILSAP